MTRYASQGATVATESHASPVDAAGRSPLLRISRLSVDFATERVLADIDVTINQGELVALAGEPGAGKTTMIRCIVGDLAPDGGRVVLAGRPVSPGRATRRGHRIGVVWQDLALCENLDVEGNLLLGQETRRLHALLGGLIIATVFNGLGLMGVSDAVQFISTAIVLIAAVTLDSLVRRRSGAAAR
jgi:ABC-type branched-subunit amino acid transport system ATPase component